MKQVIKSSIFLGASTLLMAGGDISPIVVDEPMAVQSIVSKSDNMFYVGVGYAYGTLDMERLDISDEDHDNGFFVNAGYNYNKNLGIELRYTETSGDANDNASIGYDVSNIALYIKPNYEVVNNLNIYALLGYGQTDMNDITSEAFQWGAGLSYDVTDDFSIFVEYTNLNDGSDYDNEIYDRLDRGVVLINNVDSINTVNVGVSYHF